MRAPSRDELRVVAVVAAQVRHLGGDEDHPLDAPVEQHVDVVDLAEGRAAVLQRIDASPLGAARVSIAWASAGKIGFASSGTRIPISPVSVRAPGGT